MSQSLEDRWYELDFSVCRERRYHHKRGSWYSRWSKFINFGLMLAGSGVVITTTKEMPVATTILGILTAAAGLIETVFDLGGKSKEHRSCETEYILIESDIRKIVEPTEEDYKNLFKRRSDVELREPRPVYVIVQYICENEEYHYRNINHALREINRVQHILRHWHTYDGCLLPLKNTEKDDSTAT